MDSSGTIIAACSTVVQGLLLLVSRASKASKPPMPATTTRWQLLVFFYQQKMIVGILTNIQVRTATRHQETILATIGTSCIRYHALWLMPKLSKSFLLLSSATQGSFYLAVCPAVAALTKRLTPAERFAKLEHISQLTGCIKW